MTRPSVTYGIPDPMSPREAAEVAPGRADELLGRYCTRCGAVGTHYLTCPGLQLPAGYRISEDPPPKCRCGLPVSNCGGPDHPDWPWPPRH